MHLLPTYLAPVADITGPQSGARFAVSAVRLEVRPDDTFTVTATDTKRLLRVTGPCVAPADQFPAVPALQTAPNGAADALIPAAVWKATFRDAAKLTKRTYKQELKTVAVVLGPNTATFASTDLDSTPVAATRLVEGRYPPVSEVIAQCKSAPVAFRVNPLLLADLLRAMAAVADPESTGVSFHVSGPEKLVYLTARGRDGATVEAAIMPLTS